MAQEMTTAARRQLAQTGETTRPAAIYRPDIDIFETADHVVLVADMPGVAPQDVDVTLERRVLTIRGRVPEESHEGYRKVYAEYGQGDFERSFTLSEEIDREHIEATHKNGVLTLKMPKAETAKTHKIGVKAA
ncbi:Hsp20/alpha crystallin family protein [Chelativorans intermedius]|uniref:Hsp20/alpha crystallin family protein n=1 Tax=Chelativorans intermedius TaxID=515947 RepID=A0ABV6D4G5_9HYPH|nr:Hsp20/alpha crystallin family protein [Chelativorans intermedius]MCT8997579.1 Hsp20/alpha crystallin family protein [Chelativorans intermedius]